MPKHDHGVNAVDNDTFVTSVEELITPLMNIKWNLLQAGLFPGCDEDCHLCLLTGCYLLKEVVQRLIDDKEILFEKTHVTTVSCKYVSIITISSNPFRVSTKRPVRITSAPDLAPLIITTPGPIPYSSDKVVPWNYGAGVYYHGVKQDLLAVEDEVSGNTDPDIGNIVGTSKITRSRRVFSPEISPPKAVTIPVIIPTAVPDNTITTTPVITHVATPSTKSVETRGKYILVEPVQTKAHSESILEASKREMEEILKIIKKRDYNVVEQLRQTPSKISMLALLLCSEAHAKALVNKYS
ncbi:unnamed protein product [Vicia faba]|uniref:Uncharacterized protein n=1 Tax=Vicia faba TaxID=3906 RepID=A0AAV1AR59_VICFA|nr:unnamed protein product [Vicia faba]